MAVVNRLSDLSPAAQMELIQFLEPWFQAKIKGLAGSATGTTDPNAVHFNSPNTNLVARSLTVTANEDLPGDDASIVLTAAGTVGDFDISAKGILLLRSTTDAVQVEADGGNLVLVASSNVNVTPTGDMDVFIKTGKTLTVLDNANQPIFRVDENGDLHGKTGHALVFDL